MPSEERLWALLLFLLPASLFLLSNPTCVASYAPSVQASLHKRNVNDLIHESLHGYRQTEPIAFFCECARPRCFETVWLTPMEYEKNRSNPRWRARSARH